MFDWVLKTPLIINICKGVFFVQISTSCYAWVYFPLRSSKVPKLKLRPCTQSGLNHYYKQQSVCSLGIYHKLCHIKGYEIVLRYRCYLLQNMYWQHNHNSHLMHAVQVKIMTLINPFYSSDTFLYPLKRQKFFGFLTFSGGIEMWHWTKMV